MAECNIPSLCSLTLQERDNETVMHRIETYCEKLSKHEPAVSQTHSSSQYQNQDSICNGKSKKNTEMIDSQHIQPEQSSCFSKVNGVSQDNIAALTAGHVNKSNATHDASAENTTSETVRLSSSSLKETCDTVQESLSDKLNHLSLATSERSCVKNSCDTETAPLEDCADTERTSIEYIVYDSEKQMPDIMRLITKDLSEPYSIYTYRYFIHNWPRLCFLAKADEKCVGAIVCKLDVHKKMTRRGYIAMLAVDSEYRRRQIGSTLVTKAIDAMIRDDCDEVVLETEITNQGALHLYENLGFVRDKRLFRYYLNGVDALRLKLWLR